MKLYRAEVHQRNDIGEDRSKLYPVGDGRGDGGGDGYNGGLGDGRGSGYYGQTGDGWSRIIGRVEIPKDEADQIKANSTCPAAVWAKG